MAVECSVLCPECRQWSPAHLNKPVYSPPVDQPLVTWQADGVEVAPVDGRVIKMPACALNGEVRALLEAGFTIRASFVPEDQGD